MSEIFDKNNHQNLLKDLQILGLTEKESKVYLALLISGEVGSSKIIKDTQLHGQFVYGALDTLKERGLVQEVIKRGRKKFSAKNPRALAVLIEPQKRIADRLAEELQNLMIPQTEQQIEVFQGVESYKTQEFNLLNQSPEKSEICIIGGSADQFTRILGLEFNEYEKIRNKKGIAIRYIGSEAQKHELNVLSQARERFSYRIMPGSFTGMLHTTIFPQEVSLTAFGKPVTTFTITDSRIAESHKQFFEMLWNMSTS